MPKTYHWLNDPLGAVPSRFATLDGVRIHYKSLGDGETAVIFIHGWTCDLTFWRAQVEDLRSKGRLLFLDLPGHGRSDKPKRAYTMVTVAGSTRPQFGEQAACFECFPLSF